ncbi:hypothetical protein GCM10010383_30620 [Streptomyces lomondensis]|uniref:Uncharacterized protein n=1 Tax=Streptomyces lomondensis TaxID=68229 RepID=A0ABQ2X3X5_9ACTN|nr:hypothetical protein GCM10010383_30620 [Streptomyces lomondensis]
MWGGQVAPLAAGEGVDDPDEVIALAETVVEPVAVAEGDAPAVRRPGGGAGRAVRGQWRGQQAFLPGGEVPHE